jgi:multimeric flavodoxin WrbA
MAIMKIMVLNGSPKGELSVTMQYVHYLQKVLPDNEFRIISVAHRIKKLERDRNAFLEVIGEIATADAVLWAFPLYYLLVASQYKRFIELIFENNSAAAFKGKCAAVLTTSINFYDHTAHNYMHAVCDDLDMNFVASYSAEMNDLFRIGERERFKKFGELFLQAITQKMPAVKSNKPLVPPALVYKPAKLNTEETGGKKVLIVVDSLETSSNLRLMLESLQSAFLPVPEIVQIKDIDIKGGCLGCLQCGMDNVCIYEGKDGFIDFFNTKVRTADILFFAGLIHDRYLSSIWKCFFDRSFFRGHIPAFEGKQLGFVISGPFNQIANLQQIMEAYVETQHGNLIGFVSDDVGSSEEINAGLQRMVELATIYSKNNYVKPQSFLSIGGTKIFRDTVWSRLRPVFQADHRYYKKHGYYDFPHRNYKWRLINNALVMLTKIPTVRHKFTKKIKEEMVKPFTRALAKLK